MDNQIYNGKPLSEHSLWDLGKVYQSLKEAEARREAASNHPKFDTKNNKKAIPLPPPNVNFLKLKDAIEAEIRKKQNYEK